MPDEGGISQECEICDVCDDDDHAQAGTAPSGVKKKLQEVETDLLQVESRVEALLHRQQALRSKREKLLRLVQHEQLAPKRDWQGQRISGSGSKLLAMHFA